MTHAAQFALAHGAALLFTWILVHVKIRNGFSPWIVNSGKRPPCEVVMNARNIARLLFLR